MSTIESTQDIRNLGYGTGEWISDDQKKFKKALRPGLPGQPAAEGVPGSSTKFWGGNTYAPEGLRGVVNMVYTGYAGNMRPGEAAGNILSGPTDPPGTGFDVSATYGGNPGQYSSKPNDRGTVLGAIGHSIANGDNIKQGSTTNLNDTFAGILIGGGFNSKTRSLNHNIDEHGSGYSHLGYQFDHQYGDGRGETSSTVAAIEKTGLRNIDGFKLATTQGAGGLEDSESWGSVAE